MIAKSHQSISDEIIRASEPRTFSAPSRCRTESTWWIASLALGLLALWFWKFVIYSDGISYLEIASNYRAGAWSDAVNAYWSPLYSWIVAVAGWLLRPSAQWEVPMLHLVNFLAFAGSLFTFRFFLRQLTRFVTDHGGLQTEREYRAWISAAYALFLWGGLTLTPLYLVTPDAMTNTLLYAIAGIILVIKRRSAAPGLFAALGFLLAVCYYARAAFFVVPAILILTLLASLRPFPSAARGSLITIAVFATLVAPWVGLISRIKGHSTIGESGRLNYGWEVSGVTRSTHWQGGSGASAPPLHTTRKLMDSPDVFEFSTPIKATYPPWYDPSYWYDGLRPRIDLNRQMRATLLNLRLAGGVLFCAPGFLWCILSVVSDGELWRRVRKLLVQLWWCWLPSLCLIACYSLVFVERRYIASAIVIIAMTTLAAVFCGSLSQISTRLAVWLAIATCVGFLAFPASVEMASVGADLVNAREMFPNGQFLASREAIGLGLKRGAKIAYIGNSMNADWARLLGLGIVAEVPVRFDRSTGLLLSVIVDTHELEAYWRATPQAQQKVLDAFRQAGAEAVAADLVPEWANTSDWIRLKTPIYKQEGTAWTYLRFLTLPR